MAKQESGKQPLNDLVLKDRDAVRALEFSGSNAAFNTFFGPATTGQSVYDFLIGNIQGFTTKMDASSEGVAAACASGILFVYKMYASFPQIVRISYLVHEARHCESKNRHDHIQCPTRDGFSYEGKFYKIPGIKALQKKWACDADSNGAYSVQAAFLANVFQYCTNCSEETKSLAKEHFVTDGLFRLVKERDQKALVQYGLKPRNLPVFEDFIPAVLNKFSY